MSDWKEGLQNKYGKAWTSAWVAEKCMPVRKELEYAKKQMDYMSLANKEKVEGIHKYYKQQIELVKLKTINETVRKYNQINDQLKNEFNAQIGDLKYKLTQVQAQFSESQSTVSTKNALIVEINKKHVQYVDAQKILQLACKTEISDINKAAAKASVDKKARNKKIGLGVGAAAVGYYFMNS